MSKYKKHIYWVVLVLFVLSMIPLLITARYALPFYDDYNYGRLSSQAWAETGALSQVFKAAATQSKITFENWQGSFSGIVLMALSPGIFNEKLYPIGIYIIIFLFIACFLFLFKVILKDYFKADKYITGIISLVLLFISIQFMPDASEGVFWYNGGIYYTGIFSLCMLMITLFLVFNQTDKTYVKIICTVFSLIIAVIIGGGNFVTGLSFLLVHALYIFYRIIVKKSKYLMPLSAFIVVLVCFIINITAPGNDNRKDYFTDTPGPISAILISLKEGAVFIFDTANIRIFLCFLFLVPFIIMLVRKCSFDFKYPLLVTVFSYGVYASSIVPSIYSMNTTGPGRAKNIYFFLAVLFVFFNMVYWCGWIHRKTKVLDKLLYSRLIPGYKRAMPFVLALGIIVFMVSVYFMDRNSMTTVSAVRSLYNYETVGFYNECLEQIKIFKDPEMEDCVVEAHKYKPYLLYHSNLDSDPENPANKYTALYYQKNSVICLKD